ncbi:DUF952 domain-containing protein [Rhodococcoides corynebacterioides]|uniref:DUF952 domain-containing protein n=1 Tax=Rhodococcoides corynebacterioides TaxID=53972 RepID=A0ABS7P569_9NOCA|nr:DUF952 domain-containing protein [Rhodococcus corynebacterioides]MBY6366336.1 DUF952 domain-containing protein [Rhodococcus corynebacterioides]MBY6406753.1 DUF952 domain-containing protein [Rhodococcus corynebacterioides]
MTELLHLCTQDEWAGYRAAGEIAPPSLATDGFVHLSTAEQVHLPANRLFRGRTDLLVLRVDAAALPGEVRWEPGVPGDPESMRFPHHYGPIPVGAVRRVDARPPGDDGSFGG